MERARRRAAEDHARVLAELVRGRLSAGLSQTDVGRACRMSRSAVARTEAGICTATLVELACIGAAVGLDVRLRARPAGDAIRDAGQGRLLDRLRRDLHSSLDWRTKVLLPIPGDLRAWDAVITGPGWRLGVEAETVLADIPAVERRLALKLRDDPGVDHVLLLVAETRRNRRARAAAPTAFADLAGRPHDVLAALRSGRAPRQSALVFR